MLRSTRKTVVALLSCSAFFLTSIVDHVGISHFDSAAYAKSGKGGGHGNSGGNGGGNGNSGGGNGNSASNAKGAGVGGGSFSKSNNKGKSIAKGRANNRSSKGASGGPISKLFGRLFNKKTSNPAAKSGPTVSKKTKVAKVVSKPKRIKQTRLQNLAKIPVPEIRPVAPKERNFKAKLAGLNSLKRNFHAYINSSDPRMTAVRAYVLASVEFENKSDELLVSEGQLAIVQALFSTEVTNSFAEITPYKIALGESFNYSTSDLAALQQRLADLSAESLRLQSEDPPVDVTQIDEEIAAINAFLNSPTATELQASLDLVDSIDGQVEALAAQITDEQLTAALVAAANKNRLAEYGEDKYVDEELLAWAKALLGVDSTDPDSGESVEVDGKIDEVRDYLAANAADNEGETTITQ